MVPNILSEDFFAEIKAIRRQLHVYPELAYREYKTTEIIASTLERWHLRLNRLTQLSTGGYCDVGSGPKITFRADIDALPIQENPQHVICSSHPGIMHACGHDYHIAFGLALLRYFSSSYSLKNHSLRVLFQPAEEAYPTGAIKVCEELIWDDVSYFLTAHVQNDLPLGSVAVGKTVANASSSTIEITLRGQGGHTSRPHESQDLVRISALFITNLYSYLQSQLNPLETYVLVFGAIEGGKTHNVIPETITLKGTLRTLNAEVRDLVLNYCQRYCQQFAQLHEITIDFQSPTYCPPVINDQKLLDKFRDYYSRNIDGRLIITATPSLGADDFAFYLSKAPGLYLKIGSGGKGIAHSSDFEANEDTLPFGVKMLIGFIEYLDRVA